MTVPHSGTEDAFLPLKNRAFTPPKPDAGAGPLGNLE